MSNQATSKPTTSSPRFTLTQTTTPLSQIPEFSITTPNTTTILLHATNAFGSWGAGFALAVHKIFPGADKIYKAHCEAVRLGMTGTNPWPTKDRVGTCLVIPPQPGDPGEVYIACAFTSYGYGGRAVKTGPRSHAAKDPPARVVQNTESALADLKGWLLKRKDGLDDADAKGTKDGGDAAQEDEEDEEEQQQRKRKRRKVVEEKGQVVIYSPKFNAGNFAVDWEVTAGIIKETLEDWDGGEWRILADK